MISFLYAVGLASAICFGALGLAIALDGIAGYFLFLMEQVAEASDET